jgi:hypothetical protein
MAAAAILEIEVRAIKWAITTDFDEIGTQTKKNMLSLKVTITGGVGQVSRWPPPPCWKFK